MARRGKGNGKRSPFDVKPSVRELEITAYFTAWEGESVTVLKDGFSNLAGGRGRNLSVRWDRFEGRNGQVQF